ncbi:hypothetical protein ACFQWH_11915 [Mycolicibacterium sp. GCM10028919]|uniref:hypothetical protein n=1 Tax=Mycolicibacterium sp. GCM10028919 TaxID=3273401 RepID=UPI00361E36F8
MLRRAGQWRAVEAQANGQTALVFYAAGDDGRHHGYGVQVLTLAGARIARITAFNDPALVPIFGSAPVLSR